MSGGCTDYAERRQAAARGRTPLSPPLPNQEIVSQSSSSSSLSLLFSSWSWTHNPGRLVTSVPPTGCIIAFVSFVSGPGPGTRRVSAPTPFSKNEVRTGVSVICTRVSLHPAAFQHGAQSRCWTTAFIFIFGSIYPRFCINRLKSTSGCRGLSEKILICPSLYTVVNLTVTLNFSPSPLQSIVAAPICDTGLNYNRFYMDSCTVLDWEV